jgi:hypothetical protein
MYKPKRPGPVTAAAVLFFIFGGLGLAGSLCLLGVGAILASAISNAAPPPPGQPNPFELWTMLDQRAPSLKYYLFASIAIGMVLCLIEVIAGFGLLKMRYWARNLGIFYGVVAVLLAIGGTIYNVTVMNPAMKLWQQDVQKWTQVQAQKAAPKGGAAVPPPAPPPMAASNPLVDAMGSVVGAIIGIAYPTIILILLLMPSTGKAFAIANGGALPEEDDEAFRDRPRDDFESRQIHDRPSPSEPDDDYRFRSRPE